MKEASTYEPPYSPIPATLERKIAVALKNAPPQDNKTPHVAATGRGRLAEKILAIAFEKNIKVRQDSDLAELLATLDLDTPIPPEIIVVVGEILTRVYRLNASVSNSAQNAPPHPSHSCPNDIRAISG